MTITSVIDLHNIIVSEFLNVLDTCEGNVYLVTHEGDKINLKSRIGQLISITRLIEGGKITEASIYCDNPDDESKFFRLNMFGSSGHPA